jgi:hypothetical protein
MQEHVLPHMRSLHALCTKRNTKKRRSLTHEYEQHFQCGGLISKARDNKIVTISPGGYTC